MSKNLLHYDLDFDDEEDLDVIKKFKDEEPDNPDRKRNKKKSFRNHRKNKIQQKQSWLNN